MLCYYVSVDEASCCLYCYYLTRSGSGIRLSWQSAFTHHCHVCCSSVWPVCCLSLSPLSHPVCAMSSRHSFGKQNTVLICSVCATVLTPLNAHFIVLPGLLSVCVVCVRAVVSVTDLSGCLPASPSSIHQSRIIIVQCRANQICNPLTSLVTPETDTTYHRGPSCFQLFTTLGPEFCVF